MALSESFVQLPADSTGKKVRTLQGTVGANTVEHQTFVPVDALGTALDPGKVGEYMASSFRVAGTAATNINLLTIENTTGATRAVLVRRIAIDVSISADTAYLLQSYFRLWHRTGVTPTGGTQPAKTAMDSNDAASQANTILRFGASADGTVSAITHALPARSPDREQSHPQNVVIGAKNWLPNDYELHDYAKPPLVLRAGETLLVAIAGANSATNFHYAVKVIWEEV